MCSNPNLESTWEGQLNFGDWKRSVADRTWTDGEEGETYDKKNKITRLKRVKLQFFIVKLHIYDGFDAVVRLSLFGILGAAKNNTTGWMEKKKCCTCDTHSVHFLVVLCITVTWDTQLKVFTTTYHEGQKGGSSIAIFSWKSSVPTHSYTWPISQLRK